MLSMILSAQREVIAFITQHHYVFIALSRRPIWLALKHSINIYHKYPNRISNTVSDLIFKGCKKQKLKSSNKRQARCGIFKFSDLQSFEDQKILKPKPYSIKFIEKKKNYASDGKI